MPRRLKLYKILWPGVNDEPFYTRAYDKRRAIRKYRDLVTEEGEDTDMIACWSQIQQDLETEILATCDTQTREDAPILMCSKCGEPLPDGTYYSDGSESGEFCNICEDCYMDNLGICDGCGGTFSLTELMESGEEYYCSDCLGEYGEESYDSDDEVPGPEDSGLAQEFFSRTLGVSHEAS